MKLVLITLIFILSLPSFATVSIQRIKGASRTTGPLQSDITPLQDTVYGGLSGNEADCATKDNVNACNSCGQVGLTDCNSKRIYDTLLLSVTFVSDSTAGVILVTTDNDTTTVKLNPSTIDVTVYQPNNAVTVLIPWSEICNKAFIDGTGGCDAVTNFGTKNLRIGFDSQAADATSDIGKFTSNDDFIVVPIILAKMTGVNVAPCSNGATPATANVACNFITYPGDQKVYIDNLRTGCSFPTVAGSDSAKIRAVRLLYEKDTFPTTATGTYADLTVGATNQSCTTSKVISLKENEVGNLENNQRYFFSLALVDEANNVGFFSTHTATDPNDNTNSCFDGDQWQQNCHIAAPAKVVGLLEDEFDCFITTATYGSPFKPKVKAFREFRNLFLKPNVLGQLIIRTYYKVSPPIAGWIRNHPEIKPVVRALLWPYWILSKILLISSHYIFILISLLFLVFPLKLYSGSKKAQ